MRADSIANVTDETFAHLQRLNTQLERIDIAGIHRSHRESILSQYPLGIRAALSDAYLETATQTRRVLTGNERRAAIAEGRGPDSWAQANLDLTAQHLRLKKTRIHLAGSDGEIRDMARQCAEVCSNLVLAAPARRAYEAVERVAQRHQLRMPKPERGKTLEGCVARLCDPKWWRRAIRSSYAREAENVERELGLVCRQKGLYASDDSVARRLQQRVRNRDMLESLIAVNDLGEYFAVAQLSDVNTSNPKIRRAELMTRMAGFERFAERHGHVAHFVTLTLPSRLHCVLSERGIRNPRFDGSTVRDGHDYLCRQWSRLRSYLKRHDLTLYGFRIAEPHHDGTPHWHLLIFTERDTSETVLGAFRRYFNPEGEPGDRRVDVKQIDPCKGTAAGYVAKYVSKNIDGFRVGDDDEATGASRDATETAKRVDAWASAHGIRQFQQIGGPPVTVWREVRRVRHACAGPIEAARVAAEDQEWDRFIEAMGGIDCRAGDRPVQLHTGRSSKPGQYGEPIERQIKGVRSGALIVPTRARSWTIVRTPPPAVLPWTRVNNCTAEPCDESQPTAAPAAFDRTTIASSRPDPWDRCSMRDDAS